jgi:hypothetical protein
VLAVCDVHAACGQDGALRRDNRRFVDRSSSDGLIGQGNPYLSV